MKNVILWSVQGLLAAAGLAVIMAGAVVISAVGSILGALVPFIVGALLVFVVKARAAWHPISFGACLSVIARLPQRRQPA